MNDLGHVDDYPEIPVSLASTRTALKTGAWRSVRPVLTERTAPCSAGCPAGIGIPAYLDDIREGRLHEAFAAITLRNPFPRITGRVCPHPCESGCNLTIRTTDEPVSVRAVERWLGDATADFPHVQAPTPTGKSVAVVGAGPAGMAAAYYLRRSGHRVIVFERRAALGGVLRYGIPDYRLPGDVVDDEIARLEAMGIEFRTGVALGSDIALADLEASYAAVFVATGAWQELPLDIDGAHLLEPGLAFLEAVNRGEAHFPGKHCAVVGAGNTAMDVARVLRKLGANVTVLYRRTEGEMPAIREEYELALAEGVVFAWLTLPRSVDQGASGLNVIVETMRLGEPDASGRRSPEPTGATRALTFDAIFAATGETADLAPFARSLTTNRGRLDVAGNGATSDPLVFAGGDLATGPATVIDAIVAGRRAARAIDTHLGFDDPWTADETTESVGASEVNPTYVPRVPRVAAHAAVIADPFAEEILTMTEVEALAEIERCFSCGHCNACRTCFVFCPDGAITWDEGPVIDHEFCKGCGICVVECPGHAMIMVNEREFSHA